MASTPPAASARARPSRIVSTAVTIAPSPELSFWLTVTLGPRSLNSSPARLAGALPTVLLKRSAGAPVGPPLCKAARYSLVACPPAVNVPITTPARSSPASAERVPRVLECLPRDDHRVTGRVVHAPQLHRRNPLRAARSLSPTRQRVVRQSATSNARIGAMPLSGRRAALRKTLSRVAPSGDTTPTPLIAIERDMHGVRYHPDRCGSNALRSSPVVLAIATTAIAMSAPPDLFDEIYAKRRARSNRTCSTLTAASPKPRPRRCWHARSSRAARSR